MRGVHMAGCVRSPAGSNVSSGAVGTIDTRSAAEAFLSFFVFGGNEETSLPRGNLPRFTQQLFTHYTNIYFGSGLENICGWIVQP